MVCDYVFVPGESGCGRRSSARQLPAARHVLQELRRAQVRRAVRYRGALPADDVHHDFHRRQHHRQRERQAEQPKKRAHRLLGISGVAPVTRAGSVTDRTPRYRGFGESREESVTMYRNRPP